MSGHFGTWVQPVDMVSIRAFTNLLVDAVDGKADYHDSATVVRYLEAEAGGAGADPQVRSQAAIGG